MELKSSSSDSIVCIICCKKFRFSDVGKFMYKEEQFQSVEELSNLYKIFSIHMQWATKEPLFDFNVDIFPFCIPCKYALINIWKLNDVVLNVLKEIKNSVKNLETKIIETRSVEHSSEKMTRLRNRTISRYSPTVFIENRANAQTTSKIEQDAPPAEPPWIQDFDFVCPEITIESTDNNLNDEEIIREGIRLENALTRVTSAQQNKAVIKGQLFSFDYDGEFYQCGLCYVTSKTKGDLLRHAGQAHFAAGPSPDGSSGSAQRAGLGRGKRPSKLIFGWKMRSRVEQIDEHRYIFDRQFPFELNEDKKWTCTTCNKTFFSIHTLEYHFLIKKCRTSLGELPESSLPPPPPVEESRENEPKEMLFYEKFPVQFSQGRWKCNTCNQTFRFKDGLKYHVVVLCPGADGTNDRSCVDQGENKFLFGGQWPFEVSQGDYKCGKCDVVCTTRDNILLHIGKVHIENINRDKNHLVEVSENKFLYAQKFPAEKVGDEFQCGSCAFKCKVKHALRKHISNVHLNNKKHICEDCGEGFQMLCLLRNHQMRRHVGVKNFNKKSSVCETCGKVFWTKTELNWHMVQHQDVNQVGVPCEFCGKFVYKHKLKTHLRTHAQAHQCNQCDKSFTSKWYLSVHLKSHDGSKPFACDLCDAKFAQKGSVRKHKIKQHGLVVK